VATQKKRMIEIERVMEVSLRLLSTIIVESDLGKVEQKL